MTDTKKPKPQVLWAPIRVYKAQWAGSGELRAMVCHPMVERPKVDGCALQLAKITIDPGTQKVLSVEVEDI